MKTARVSLGTKKLVLGIGGLLVMLALWLVPVRATDYPVGRKIPDGPVEHWSCPPPIAAVFREDKSVPGISFPEGETFDCRMVALPRVIAGTLIGVFALTLIRPNRRDPVADAILSEQP